MRSAARRLPQRWRAPLALGVALAGSSLLAYAFLAMPDALIWGYDLDAYVEAARRLVEQGSLYQAQQLEGPFRPGPYGLYLYAPPFGVAFLPFVEVDRAQLVAAWYAVRTLTLVAACAIMPVRPLLRLVTFGGAALSPAVVSDLLLGNVSVLLVLPMAITWRWLDRPVAWSGLAVAVFLRPTLGLLMAWALLTRRLGAVGVSAAVGVGLVLATLPFVGLEGWLDFLTVLRNISGVMGVSTNRDLGSTVLLLGWGEGAASVALLAGYVIAAIAFLIALRRDREVGFMVTLGASLLLSPLLWMHYLATLVITAAFLASRGRPWGLLLLPLMWLPPIFLPLFAVAATLLPLAARPASPGHPAPGTPERIRPADGTAVTRSVPA